MFHHYRDVLDNKLQLAIGIIGIILGLCFHLLPRLPKIISLAKHKTNSIVTEEDFHMITTFCYMISAAYAHKTKDPLFLAFNLTGFLISFAYAIIAVISLPEDKQRVRDASRGKIRALRYVVWWALMVSVTVIKSRILLGVLSTIAFSVVLCGVKLGFQTRDVGPVWVLVMSSLVMILNGGIWVAYGVFVKDAFICVSSGIGCAAGVAYLVLLRVKKNRNNDNKVAPVGDDGDRNA